MKTILTLCFSLTSLICFSQVDSAGVNVTVTLKAQHFYIIKGYIQTDDNPDLLNYYKQVAAQADSVYLPNKMITVTVPSRFLVFVYEKMGQQQERFTSQVNADIKTALLPQLAGYTWIIKKIQALNTAVQGDVLRRSMAGWLFYRSIK